MAMIRNIQTVHFMVYIVEQLIFTKLIENNVDVTMFNQLLKDIIPIIKQQCSYTLDHRDISKMRGIARSLAIVSAITDTMMYADSKILREQLATANKDFKPTDLIMVSPRLVVTREHCVYSISIFLHDVCTNNDQRKVFYTYTIISKKNTKQFLFCLL